ncbi:hypothetical protein BY996DRAFT_6541104 [Phakopsora pachyrhizi]|nr:hypothetical protein BY996DRAFT_6541104 [Phakopsora pachyrhizi]
MGLAGWPGKVVWDWLAGWPGVTGINQTLIDSKFGPGAGRQAGEDGAGWVWLGPGLIRQERMGLAGSRINPERMALAGAWLGLAKSRIDWTLINPGPGPGAGWQEIKGAGWVETGPGLGLAIDQGAYKMTGLAGAGFGSITT